MNIMNTTSTSDLTLKRLIYADRDFLFHAFSDPKWMNQWFFGGKNWSASIWNDFHDGGRYEIDMTSDSSNTYNYEGVYKEIIPGEKISFTWNSQIVEGSLVIVEFKDAPVGTQVEITHKFLPNEHWKREHLKIWNACLDNLVRLRS